MFGWYMKLKIINGRELKIPRSVMVGALRASENLSLKSWEIFPSSLTSLKLAPKMVKTINRLIPKLIKLENRRADKFLGNEHGKSNKNQ